GDLAQTTDFVNVRRSPGVANKPGDDVLGALLPRSTVVILDGSEKVDGLAWWRVGGILVPGGEVRGWVAEATPAAGALLRYAPKLPGTGVPDPLTGVYLTAPYAGTFDISQLWGENADHYSRFSYDGVPLLGHNGIDFWLPEGTPVQAVDGAVVQQVGFEQDGFGNYVLLRHPWGESIYAHLSGVDVSQGQQLAAGQVFGRSGNTGGSTGPHLHFAIRIDPYQRTDGWGGFSDPLPYLPPESYRLPPYILDQAAPSLAAALPSLAGAPRMAPPSMGNIPSELRP
ncbi:MAG: M23 family metallopeptidase, partial [Caldilineaceae bacterium]|nr:M23 family metallopeptidase [Caldilineaceae bacterium]